MRLPPSLLGLLLLLPSGGMAHPGDEYDSLTAEEGDLLAYVTFETLVVKAGREVLLHVGLHDNRTYAPLTGLAVSYEAVGPTGRIGGDLDAREDAYAGRLAFPGPGDWTFTLHSDRSSSSPAVRLVVYPATDHHVESTDARYGSFYTDPESRIVFRFVEDRTGEPSPRSGPAWARIERLDEAGATLATTERSLERNEGGADTLVYAFGDAGTYRLWLRDPDLGLAYGDLPPYTLRVQPGRDPEAPSDEVPLPAALAFLALAAVALAGRRR